MAISYIYNEFKIASRSFAMTMWYYAKLSKNLGRKRTTFIVNVVEIENIKRLFMCNAQVHIVPHEIRPSVIAFSHCICLLQERFIV